MPPGRRQHGAPATTAQTSTAQEPTTAPAPAAAPMAADPAAAFGAAIGDMIEVAWPGLNLPAQQLARLQGDYLKDATDVWNETLQRLQPEGQAAAAAAATAASPPRDWPRTRPRPITAQMYLLNARTLMQMAESVEGDAKTKARIRFAVQQWVDATSPSNFLAFNPEALQKALDTKGESIATGMQHLLRGPAARAMSRRPTRRVFEVGRNVATTEGSGGVRERALPAHRIQAADGQGARAADAVRAAVHQQVLHPRPAARELGHPLHGRAGPPHLRRQLAQPRRQSLRPTRPGTTTSTTARSAPSRWCSELTGAKTINTLGFCVGGTILSTALAVLAARGEQPAHSVTLLTTLLDFERHRHPRHLRRRGLGAAARDDDRRAGAHRPRPAQGPGTGHHLQLPAARTTWSGTTSSATT